MSHDDPLMAVLARVPDLARSAVEIPLKRLGVVDSAVPGAITVLVDGDDEATAMLNLTGLPLPAGARVVVDFWPPHGVGVTGIIGPTVMPTRVVEQVTGAGGLTASAAFVDLPVALQALDFVKGWNDSALVVEYHGTVANDNALGEWEVGVLVDGTDYPMASYFGGVPVSGVVRIDGLAAGPYDIEARMRVANAVGNTVQGVGLCSIVVTETY